jgi:(1->4)-alpha-D-glucan 1-alpha-D-glucosylmutase
MLAYMEKAVREAKQQTSWTQPNKEFEDALRSFIDQILESRDFVAELESLVGHILPAGRINSLAQTLLKFTAPGVPDTYQGSELWDLRLVDPDNRAPVDYTQRQAMLNELKKGMSPEEIMRRVDCGLPKLWVTYCALDLRSRHPEWFGADAACTPLLASGGRAENLVAFLRGTHVAAIIPRWPLKVDSSWGATNLELPAGRWRNVLTDDVIDGGRPRAQALLHRFPVALLIKES